MNIINNFFRIFNNNLFKYFPWFLLGLLTSLLISDFDVNAQNIVFDSCNYYADTSGNGTLSAYAIGNNTWYNCSSNSQITGKEAVRFNFNGVQHNQSGFGIVSFLYTAPVNAQLSSASLQTSGNQYTCSVSTGYSYTELNDGNISYAIFCNNIPLYGNQNFIFRLNLNGTSNNASFGYLNTSVNFYSEQQIANNIINNQNSINNSINDVNDSITSSDVDTGALDDIQVNNGNGVLSSILTLPLRFFTNLNNSLSTAKSSADSRALCNGITINLPFVDMPFTLPCGRDLLNSMGALQFYESIGLLCGGLCMFYYILHLGKQLSDMMTLKEIRAEWGGL